MLESYCHEIDFFSENIVEKNVKTIFFGGGTPSLMPISLVEKILAKIAEKFTILENCEITLEANPTSVEAQKFADLKKIGVKRLSLGIQALNPDDLKFLGREHSVNEAENAIQLAQKYFTNFSFDLIYARPNQTLKSWRKELAKALSFNPPHLSLYQLTIEKGTKFYSQFQRKELIMPDENLSAQFYETTNEIMINKGFGHYEISNYALKNFESLHNLAYWHSDDYIGIGAGAHSRAYFKNQRLRQAVQMIAEPNAWIEQNKKQQNGIQKIEDVAELNLIEEIIMMGLRLENGISETVFKKHLNKNFSQIFDSKKLNFLIENGFLKMDLTSANLFIPQEKRILTNSIIEKVCLSCVD
jgi:oxygen-independent coproporphyrinogen-3 oxidase